MTKIEKLQKVREAIIKACPEIMELKLGCRIRTYIAQGLSAHQFMVNSDTNEVYAVMEFSIEHIEILGSPIGITEVLRAVHRQIESFSDKVPTFEITCYGLIIGTTYDWEAEPIFWDLENDNLNNQSEECINLLFNIFYPNE